MAERPNDNAPRNRDPASIPGMSLPLALRESRVPGLLRSILVIGTLFVGGAVAWAFIGEVEEIARVDGEITPVGKSHIVKHLEGGMVAQLLVKNGEIVEKNQPLLILQPVAAEGDLGQLGARREALEIRIARLSALLDGTDFTVPEETTKSRPGLMATERALLTSTRAALAEKRKVLDARLERHRGGLAALIGLKRTVSEQARLLGEQVKMQRTLVKKGLVSRLVFLDRQRMYQRAIGEVVDIDGRIAGTRKEIDESQSAIGELAADSRRIALDERSAAMAELAVVTASISKYRDRVNRLSLRAPVRGLIHDLAVRNVGDLIAPGAKVAEVIPTDVGLTADIRIKPRDIGHIAVGHPARVSLSAFDAVRFGTLPGKVDHISAATFRDERGNPYYRATISLSRESLSSRGRTHAILPGMEVNAEIVTGAKTLARYLLRPVYWSLETAFTER